MQVVWVGFDKKKSTGWPVSAERDNVGVGQIVAVARWRAFPRNMKALAPLTLGKDIAHDGVFIIYILPPILLISRL